MKRERDSDGREIDHHTLQVIRTQAVKAVRDGQSVKSVAAASGLNVISAVSPRGEFRIMVHEGSVTAPVFKQFLQRLLIGAKRPIYLIVDGYPTHKAKLVHRYIDSTEGKLKLFLLPPYAPQLNPDEQVWAQVKREVSKRGVQDKDHLKRLAISALRRIQRLPALVRSFFQQPECRYIVS